MGAFGGWALDYLDRRDDESIAPSRSDGDQRKSYGAVTLMAVFFVSLCIRLLHNGFMMESPLYSFPLGGHVPYLMMAREIVTGNMFPFDGPISLNSPLYPYILAFLYKIGGQENFLFIRLAGILIDSLNCLLIAFLADRHFGRLAGLFSGFMAACYGAMVFFAAELTPVPYTLFLVLLSILLLDGARGNFVFLISGMLMGLAVGTRPNLLILAALILVVPFWVKIKRPFTKSALLAAGMATMILPITLANYTTSNQFILLTVSAGHNFYIGHNPQATAGYTLPGVFDGDIFKNMKHLAEQSQGHPLADHEVSPYFIKKALQYMMEEPGKEILVLCKRFLATLNHHEATTYANYDYQKEISPVLRLCLGFGMIFPLSVIGMGAAGKKDFMLYLPVIATVVTILSFFYISRLRMPMVPFLIVFAGAGGSFLVNHLKQRHLKKLLAGGLAGGMAYGVSALKLTEVDTSNEWNKVGIVLRLQKKYGRAELAFQKALQENPHNPNVYLNLRVLYDTLGMTEKAAEARRKAEALMPGGGEGAFITHLRER